MSAASARRDVAIFGAIRAASGVVSFFGAFYLIGTGRAEAYGHYLAQFALAGLVGIGLRLGADHTLQRLARSSVEATGAPDLRARVFRGWLTVWAGAFLLALAGAVLLALAGAPWGWTILAGTLFGLSRMTGFYLRARRRPRPVPIFDPPFMHLFGVGLLCLGAGPQVAMGAGTALWLATGAAVFVRVMGRDAVRRIARAPGLLRWRLRRLGAVAAGYLLEIGFGSGVYLLIQGLHGPVALAQFNAIMKLNFVSEQAQMFQRIFRVGEGRGERAAAGARPGAAPDALPGAPLEAKGAGAAGASGGLKARLRGLAARLGGGLRGPGSGGPGSGPVETAFFVLASAAANAVILVFLLEHSFETLPGWGFYVLLVALQSASLAAGPAIFSIWIYGNIALANSLRFAAAAGLALSILLLPAQPELWVLAHVGLLAAVRCAARAVWKRNAA